MTTRLVGCLSIVVVCLAHAIGLQAAQHSEKSGSLVYVSANTVKNWLAQNKPVTFLDVREPEEFEAGHLPNAINVAWQDVAAHAETLPHDRSIVIYCIHSAYRAPEAAKTLRQLGFENAYVLEGGIVAWQAGGQTIIASNPSQPATILPKTERCAQPQHASN